MIPFEIGCKITSKIWNNKHFISFFVENLSFCHFIDINQGKRSFLWPLHVPEHNQSHIYIIKSQVQTKVILRYFNYEHRLLMWNHINFNQKPVSLIDYTYCSSWAARYRGRVRLRRKWWRVWSCCRARNSRRGRRRPPWQGSSRRGVSV